MKRTVSFKSRSGKKLSFLVRRKPKHIHDFNFLLELGFQKDRFQCDQCECGKVKWIKLKQEIEK